MLHWFLQTQLEIDKALEADPTVYEYDSIYDTMQEKKAQQVSANSSKAKVDRKVCLFIFACLLFDIMCNIYWLLLCILALVKRSTSHRFLW